MNDVWLGLLLAFQDGVRHVWPSSSSAAAPHPDEATSTAPKRPNCRAHQTCAPDADTLLWYCCGFALSYWLFSRIFTALLLRFRIAGHRCRATVRHVWLIGFYAAALVSLTVYYTVVLAPLIRRDNGLLFPRYGRSALMMPAGSASLTASRLGNGGGRRIAGDYWSERGVAACSETSQRVATILVAFHVVDGALLLNGRDFVEAGSTLGLALVLQALQANGLENFTVLLSIWLGLYHLISAVVHTVALHTRRDNERLLGVLLAVRLVTWSYAYLHMLPFDYLVPGTARRSLWLNACLWLWYGTGVWQSPVLHYCYRRLNRSRESATATAAAAVATSGEENATRQSTTMTPPPPPPRSAEPIARCVLVRRTPEYQHFLSLQLAYASILEAQRLATLGSREPGENTGKASARALQTVKCMMMLKRKLKRIRAANQNATIGMLP